MASKQSEFLDEFKEAFQRRFAQTFEWRGGQVVGNKGHLVSHAAGRRPVGRRGTEQFELGDLTTKYQGYRIVVEFEEGALPLSNLLKYWPYIRGELSLQPEQPIVLCHFSDWWSYATRRDLWEWTLSRMQSDSERKVHIIGRQFDHWGRHIADGGEASKRAECIDDAIKWIAMSTRSEELTPTPI
jgi:hypothetical protein